MCLSKLRIYYCKCNKSRCKNYFINTYTVYGEKKYLYKSPHLILCVCVCVSAANHNRGFNYSSIELCFEEMHLALCTFVSLSLSHTSWLNADEHEEDQLERSKACSWRVAFRRTLMLMTEKYSQMWRVCFLCRSKPLILFSTLLFVDILCKTTVALLLRSETT